MNTIKVKVCNEIINHSLIKRITTHPFGGPNPFQFLSMKESGIPGKYNKEKVYFAQMRVEELFPQVSNLSDC